MLKFYGNSSFTALFGGQINLWAQFQLGAIQRRLVVGDSILSDEGKATLLSEGFHVWVHDYIDAAKRRPRNVIISRISKGDWEMEKIEVEKSQTALADIGARLNKAQSINIEYVLKQMERVEKFTNVLFSPASIGGIPRICYWLNAKGIITNPVAIAESDIITIPPLRGMYRFCRPLPYFNSLGGFIDSHGYLGKAECLNSGLPINSAQYEACYNDHSSIFFDAVFRPRGVRCIRVGGGLYLQRFDKETPTIVSSTDYDDFMASLPDPDEKL